MIKGISLLFPLSLQAKYEFEYNIKIGLVEKPNLLIPKICRQFDTYKIRHFKTEKENGAETCPAIVSEIVTGDAPVSYGQFFPCPY